MLAERYELKTLLGRGGMAEVFEAVAHGAHGFTRRVAIKRLLPGFGDDATFVRMFFDEAKIASRLHHANIVAVLDFAVTEGADGAPFQVLELVDGWDLASLMDRGEPIPIEIALHVTTEVAHALAYAHEARSDDGTPLGIVHRDVKPSNVLLSKSGEVKLGDFGIAFARQRISETTGEIPRGTPPFMSPEQFLGGITVDAASDVFALGCTLHALLTGASPLEDQAARMKFLVGTSPPLSDALPPDVRAIVERAVQRKPEDRWPSARAMAAATGAALAARLQTDPKSFVGSWLDRAKPVRTTEAAVGQRVLTRGPDNLGRRHFTVALAPTELAPRVATPAKRDGRTKIFVIAVASPLVLAGVGAVGVIFGRSTVHPPPPPPALSVTPVETIDAAPIAEPVDAAPSTTAIASVAPPPKPQRCFCHAAHGQGRSPLCPVGPAPAAKCRCVTEQGGLAMCFVTKETTDLQCRVQVSEVTGSGAYNGGACLAYKLIGGGARTETEAMLSKGVLTDCSRCSRTEARSFALPPGSPCKGIQNEDGVVVPGVVRCD